MIGHWKYRQGVAIWCVTYGQLRLWADVGTEIARMQWLAVGGPS